MSKKEREYLVVFRKIESRAITHLEAAKQLSTSERWVRKKYARYKKYGDAGLVHRSRGKASGRRWNEKEKEVAIKLLSNEWQGFGPTFTAEKLGELQNITVSKETVRKMMIEAGLWHRQARRSKHRKRRLRRPMVGIMIQLDGSFHDWFEGRAGPCSLLVFIDDATSKIMWLEFCEREANNSVMQATKNYMSLYGRPHLFYVDFGAVFSVNLNNAERDKKTQLERALGEIGVKMLHAHSPQAKGRVERANRTMQDRLIKEMRLAGTSSIEAANRFVRESNFIERHNTRCAVTPSAPGDAHRPIDNSTLDCVFCIKEQRSLANDYTIVYKKRIFQLVAHQSMLIRPRDIITVNTRLDGTIWLSIRATSLAFHEIIARTVKPKEEKCLSNVPFKPHENSRRWVAGLPPLNPQKSMQRVA